MPLFYHKYVNYVLAHSVNYVITLYIYIGANFMRIKIAKLYISPVVFHGYVEIKKESLLEMEKHELVIFFLSGAVGNVFLIGVSLLLVSNFINFYFSIVNICYATASVLPFIIGNNDMTTMIKVLKEKQKMSKTDI